MFTDIKICDSDVAAFAYSICFRRCVNYGDVIENHT